MMTATDVSAIDGKLVLVCSAQDHRNPPTGRRGTIFVRDASNGGRARVEIEIEFPQMFTTAAHTRRVVLNDEQVAQMLASEYRGVFSLTLTERLDPVAPAGAE